MARALVEVERAVPCRSAGCGSCAGRAPRWDPACRLAGAGRQVAGRWPRRLVCRRRGHVTLEHGCRPQRWVPEHRQPECSISWAPAHATCRRGRVLVAGVGRRDPGLNRPRALDHVNELSRRGCPVYQRREMSAVARWAGDAGRGGQVRGTLGPSGDSRAIVRHRAGGPATTACNRESARRGPRGGRSALTLSIPRGS